MKVESLGDALDALIGNEPIKLPAALERLPSLDSFIVAGSEWTGGFFFFRLVLASLRENTINASDAIALAKPLLDFGASDQTLCNAFQKAIIEFGEGRRQQEILKFVQWMHSKLPQTAAIVRNWASDALGRVIKDAVWAKWKRGWGYGNIPLSPINVQALLRLGATPDSYPPAQHREQHPVGFYAIELGNPRISSVLFTPRAGGPKNWRATRKTTGKTHPARSATRSERDRIVDALRRSGLDPRTGEADNRPSARHRLDRLIDLMNTRYLPSLRRINLDDVDRKRSMLGGIPFTSKRFPWPGPARAPHAPLVQLNLAEMSASAGIDMGCNFLQLWCPINKGMVGTGVVSLEVRVIPRAVITRTRHLAPPPAIVIECHNDPNYSWKQSLLGAPRYITGWRKGGFALPDLTEFDTDSELRALSVRPQRPELGLAMFECPTLYRHFFDLPLEWRPLVKINGPVQGATFGGRSVIFDRAEIYFSHSRSGRVSFRAAWIRDEGIWSDMEEG